MTDTHNALALASELDTKAQALGCPLDRFSAVLRLQHTRIAELEAMLDALGAGGVGQSIKPQIQADTAPQPARQLLTDDAKRLDWLMLNISGAEFRRIGIEYSGICTRKDIDNAIERENGITGGQQ